jgi:hypothetical protein
MSKLRALVAEIVADPPVNHCADDGDHCPFCHIRISFWPHEKDTHAPDCWLTRAAALLKEEEI